MTITVADFKAKFAPTFDNTSEALIQEQIDFVVATKNEDAFGDQWDFYMGWKVFQLLNLLPKGVPSGMRSVSNPAFTSADFVVKELEDQAGAANRIILNEPAEL